MGSITIHETVDAPVETVFAYVDDHRNTTRYMQGLTKWKPTGSTTHGKGAQFEVAMKAGPSTLSSVVDITTWTENRAIGWTSVEGFKQKGQWSFKPKGEQTELTFTMTYELPGGIAGRMLSRAADPIVRSNLQKSARTLKQQAEHQASSRGGAKTAPKSAAKTPAKSAAKPSAKSAAKSSAQSSARGGTRSSKSAATSARTSKPAKR
jgi:uncharacterized membrane protein